MSGSRARAVRHVCAALAFAALTSCGLLAKFDELTAGGPCVGDTCADGAAPGTPGTPDDTTDAGTVPGTDPTTSGDGGGARDATAFKDATVDPASCPAVPAEWTSVTIATGDAGCSSGFGRTLFANPRSAADGCACSCGAASSNPCEYNDGVYNFGVSVPPFSSNCGGGATVFTAGCFQTNWSTAVNAVRGDARPPVQVSCPASATLPAIASDARLNVCALSAGAPTCGAGACVMHEGTELPCLDGFSVRRELVAEADLVDGRTCGECACSTHATKCNDATFTLYTDDKCTTGGRTAAFDGTCRPFNSSGFSPKSGQYHATPDVTTCVPTNPTSPVKGEVTASKKITVCCAEP